MAVGADWGGGFFDSILVGLEFGAVGGSKLSKNGSIWAGKKGFRCVHWRGGGVKDWIRIKAGNGVLDKLCVEVG